MKHKLFLLGTLALVAAFGLVVMGCKPAPSGGNGGGGQPPTTTNAATPTISAHPLSASYNYGEVSPAALTVTASTSDSGTLSYQWYKNTANSDTSGTEVGTAATYTPVIAAPGSGEIHDYYYVVVTNTNNSVNGTQTATATSTVADIMTTDAPSAGLYRDSDLTTQIDLSTTAGTTILAKALKWLDDNPGDTETDYTIILPSGVTQSPPNTLSASTFKSGAKLTLKGVDSTSVIKLTSQGSLFTIAPSSNITLVLAENITLKGLSIAKNSDTTNNNAELVSVNSGDILEMKANAKITGNTAPYDGSGVNVVNGTFSMSGSATISENSTGSLGAAGGVNVENGTFSMSDNASISGNTTSSSSGGVWVYSSIFSMTGSASISGNTASSTGGGVRVSDSTFTMSDSASISGNTASSSSFGGGGVYVSSSTFTMNDNASISGNTASSSGGGVNVSSGTFTMNDSASISGNTASGYGGGGVCVSSGTFSMSDSASISGNTASSVGGGVYLSGGTFTKTGGVIYGDTDSGHNTGDIENTVTGYISGGGHAVRVTNGKYRDSTAGAEINMSWDGTTGIGFEN